MRHRIFVAINLPEDIRKELASYNNKWPELPARWTKKDNLHITLEFLGHVSDWEILEVFKTAKETASRHKSFEIKLNKICYGPLGKMPPRMIWAVGDKIKDFNIVPHITLARLRTWQWKQIEPEERPNVEEDINLTFEVNSIEIMESNLDKKGPKYTILESYPLNQYQ